MAKTGANEPCPCGSGKKYKQCCRKQDIEKQPQKVRTRLSWESMLLAAPEEQAEIASSILRRGGFSPDQIRGWLGLAQLSLSRDTDIAKMAFEQGCRVAKTPEDWRELIHLAMEMDLLERAAEIMEAHVPREHDDTVKEWATRAFLLSHDRQWEEAAQLWGKQIEATQKPDFLWRWITCLRNTKQLDLLQAACIRAEELTQDPIWRIVWANAISLADREEEALSILHESFISALKTPADPSNSNTERTQREMILLEAGILYLTRLDHTERTVFLRVLLKRKVPPLTPLFEARSDIAALCSGWEELAQETTRWSANESSPKARWLRRVAQYIVNPATHPLDASTEIPAFWASWGTSLQNNLLHALLEKDALPLLDALFARLPLPQEESQLFLWATLRAKQSAWQPLAQALQPPPIPLTPRLAMLHALAILHSQGPEAAAPFFDSIETSEDTDLALSIDLWRVDIACRLHKEDQAAALLDHIATYTPPAQRSERYWVCRAHLAHRQKQLPEILASRQALFALRPNQEDFFVVAHTLALLERNHEAIAWLQQHRHSVRWNQDLSWLLACCAVHVEQWELASDALQTLDEAWISAPPPKKHLWPLRAHIASKCNRWLDTLAACERWESEKYPSDLSDNALSSESSDALHDALSSEPPDALHDALSSEPSDALHDAPSSESSDALHDAPSSESSDALHDALSAEPSDRVHEALSAEPSGGIHEALSAESPDSGRDVPSSEESGSAESFSDRPTDSDGEIASSPSLQDAEDLASLQELRRLAVQNLLLEAKHPWTFSMLSNRTNSEHHPLMPRVEAIDKEATQAFHQQQETLFEDISSEPKPPLQPHASDPENDTLSLLLSHPALPAYPLSDLPPSTETEALHPPEEQVYVEAWGEEVWAFLPKGTQQTFASAERLWTLLSQEEEADHAPILLQWTRGLEALLNLHLVDPLVFFAERRLSLHVQRDLPRLAGRPLQSYDNHIGLGSLPFLLVEQWKKPDPSDEKDEIAYNYLVTAGQRLLWTAWSRHLKDILPPHQLRFLQEELPSLCAKLAYLRSQAAHAAHTTTPLPRQRIQQLRQELFLRKDSLLIPSLARPLATTALR
ncbi:SEC-C domain-containing protein [Myxococcota bacterium]|nr:SEC-C domain-containing protein [Myxococcota bacterium]